MCGDTKMGLAGVRGYAAASSDLRGAAMGLEPAGRPESNEVADLDARLVCGKSVEVDDLDGCHSFAASIEVDELDGCHASAGSTEVDDLDGCHSSVESIEVDDLDGCHSFAESGEVDDLDGCHSPSPHCSLAPWAELYSPSAVRDSSSANRSTW